MTREWTDKVGHKTALSHQRRPAAAEGGKKNALLQVLAEEMCEKA